jgi:hypothetical protein
MLPTDAPRVAPRGPVVPFNVRQYHINSLKLLKYVLDGVWPQIVACVPVRLLLVASTSIEPTVARVESRQLFSNKSRLEDDFFSNKSMQLAKRRAIFTYKFQIHR